MKKIRKLYTNPRNFINKYATIKYEILSKYGGVYTDLDIKWKIPFTKIQQIHNPANNNPLIFSHGVYTRYYVKGIQKAVLDDPFIIANIPNLMGECLEY